MVWAVRSLVLVLSLCLTPAIRAEIIGYEWVFQSGKNNVIDSNAGACSPTLGCFDRTMTPRRDYFLAGSPQICDLQPVPVGHCTYGAPGNACVWPHQAGHCEDYPDIGCLSDDYADDPWDQTQSGPSRLCGGANCLMDVDPFGQPFNYDCFCGPSLPQGTDGVARELAICGRPAACAPTAPRPRHRRFGLASDGVVVGGAPGGLFNPALGHREWNAVSVDFTAIRSRIADLVALQRDPGTIRTVPNPVRSTWRRRARRST
jgi:hypothetical protein